MKLPLEQGSTHATPAGVLVPRTCVGLAPHAAQAYMVVSQGGHGIAARLATPAVLKMYLVLLTWKSDQWRL